jgi:hypothetical protein
MSGFGFDDPSGALLSSDTRAISALCLIGRDDPGAENGYNDRTFGALKERALRADMQVVCPGTDL